MKILLFGHRGWIGSQFKQLAEQNGQIELVEASSYPGKDDDQVVKAEIHRVLPTHVALFIGRTHGPGYSTIDYLEDQLELNVRDNLYAPMLLALLCQKLQIHLTYLGTGCIFHYDQVHDFSLTNRFTEEDRPNFFGSAYSVVKGFTDRLMHQLTDNVLNLRIRMPVSYDDHQRNFITKITSYAKVVDVPNSVTVLPQLLPLVLKMMQSKTTGTINLVNPGAISHNQILTMYREIVDPEFTWTNFTIEEQNSILKAKRSNCCLATDKLSQMFPEVLPAEEAIRVALTEMAKAKN